MHALPLSVLVVQVNGLGVVLDADIARMQVVVGHLDVLKPREQMYNLV